MLDSAQVPICQSALLVIDAQDYFKATPRWDRRDNLDFEKNMAALIEAYRTARLPIIYFLHKDNDEGFAPKSPFSSAVTARNKIERLGAGCVWASACAISRIEATPEALSAAPLKI